MTAIAFSSISTCFNKLNATRRENMKDNHLGWRKGEAKDDVMPHDGTMVLVRGLELLQQYIDKLHLALNRFRVEKLLAEFDP